MTLTAVLFVGGLSTRMGRDKAELEWRGETLWHRQLTLLRQLQPAHVAVSCRTVPSWCPADVEAILDGTHSHGPLSGVAAVSNQLRTSHFLALAVDLPEMTQTILQRLWKMSTDQTGAVARIGTRWEPLAAIYPSSCVAAVRRQMNAGRWSLQDLMRELLHSGEMIEWRVPEEMQSAFLNFNSPADLEKRCC